MILGLIGPLVLAMTMTQQNPRFCSPNGESCVVLRVRPEIADFAKVEEAEPDSVDAWLDTDPLPRETKKDEPPKSLQGALYRILPSGNRELLGEFTFAPDSSPESTLVANDGRFVTFASRRCGPDAELLTIHAADASIVRRLKVRDVFTRHDQQWVCRRSAWMRWLLDEQHNQLHAKILLTERSWNDPDARHHTIEIDLSTGDVPAPDRDFCPPVIKVTAEVDDGAGPEPHNMVIGTDAAFKDDEVVAIASAALLERAVVRVIPEYPEVAYKARIGGAVRVEVVIDRDGSIAAARLRPLPFGIEAEVVKALAQWKFAPDAHRTSGSFLFRFEIVRPPAVTTTHTRVHLSGTPVANVTVLR